MSVLSIEAAADERTLTSFTLNTEKKPFGLTVSDRAIYFVELDRWSLKEPWVVRRIPIEQVRVLSLERTRALPILALASLMIIGGGALTAIGLVALFQDGDAELLRAWPVLLLVAGCILPFSARGRRTLRLSFTNRRAFQWSPPMFLTPTAKHAVNEMLADVAYAAESLGVRVVRDRDER